MQLICSCISAVTSKAAYKRHWLWGVMVENFMIAMRYIGVPVAVSVLPAADLSAQQGTLQQGTLGANRWGLN